jgi:long-chain acyl-CoA synthetase
MLNLASLLKDSARKHPTRNAVVLGEIRLDCAGLDALADQVANRLDSRGIEPGDKVALPCPNVPDLPATYDGILKSGAVVVPLNVLLKSREQMAAHRYPRTVALAGTPPMTSTGKLFKRELVAS